MLIPIRDENPTSRTAWVTLALIAANIVIFLFWQPTFATGDLGEAEQVVFFYCNAEVPWEVSNQTSLADGGQEALQAIRQANPGVNAEALQAVLQGRADEIFPQGNPLSNLEGCPNKSWVASIFVAMFLHGGWLHIGGNMLFLWVFGNNVEDRMNPLVFIGFYLLGGLAAAGAQIATDPDAAIPNLGASGAIAAVLGAYLVMYPRHRVLSLVPIFFLFTLVELPAIVVLGFWFILQLFSGVGSITAEVTGGVAYWAHIGGFAAGLLVALLFYRRKPPVPVERWPTL
jgi:membrane associated rhomboid family serine protease